jgi:hypothetical protein
MTLGGVSGGLTTTSAAAGALSARLADWHAEANPIIRAVVTPTADSLSLHTAPRFNAPGSEHAVVATQVVEELARPGAGVGCSGVSYATVLAEAASYLNARAWR